MTIMTILILLLIIIIIIIIMIIVIHLMFINKLQIAVPSKKACVSIRGIGGNGKP